MKAPFKILSLIFTLLCISFLYLSFGNKNSFQPKQLVAAESYTPAIVEKSVYDSLQLDLAGLNRDAFENAKKGWEKLAGEGKLSNPSIMAIVDFSQPSAKKRLYVLDMENYKVLFNTLVAHGRNSGKDWAKSFSNKISSFKSSPGFYITGETYTGSNGYSLRLTGLEQGINDNALKRAIVMHGADYVSESFIPSLGYIGRSQGCPAVPLRDAKNIINTLKDGACLYIYAPDQKYLTRSVMLRDSLGV
jgi:hypothetical protein